MAEVTDGRPTRPRDDAAGRAGAERRPYDAEAERRPCDADVRDRVTTRLDHTYLVEAAAGTGKTALLVDRYLSCVEANAPVGRIAAITFTEKAAGELRFRVRDEVARRLRDEREGPLSPARRRLLATALRELDDAPISTIHAFAARLLRERPVDLGVDPAFEQLDAFGAALFHDRAWQSWLGHVLSGADDAGREAERVAELLRAGVRLDGLAELAGVAFRERYDLDDVRPPRCAPDLGARVAAVRRGLLALDEHCRGQCEDPSDRGRGRALELAAAADGLADVASGDVHQQAAALRALPLFGKPQGRKTSWAGDGKARMLEIWEDVRAEVRAALDDYGDHVCRCGIAAAQSFVAFAEHQARSEGVLDFGDLLGKLRDALRDRPEVRCQLQTAFDFLLVDEFQDTDPLQAEVIAYLAQDGERGIGVDPAPAWDRVLLTPGKLFVVGDPKQSIYRFRRADITVYAKMADLVEAQPGSGSVERIVQNFRTSPAVARWVDHEVGAAMAADTSRGRQPEYVALTPWRPEIEEFGVALLEPHEEGDDGIRAAEARALAAVVVDGVRGGAWRVAERARRSDGGAESTRPAKWSDVAVLLRAFTHADAVERALQDAGVPFRTEGGRSFFQRREVADVLLLLRAVDDPGDLPAVYGTLHSSLFGFSDEELLSYRLRGGTFDMTAVADKDGGDDVAAALDLLRGLHVARGGRSVAQTVDEALRLTRAAESLTAAGDRSLQAVANLEKLEAMARTFDGEESATLGGFVRWAAEAAAQAAEAESLPSGDGDAVRIMSIHAAKGLEFPVVILAMAGARGRSGDRRGVLVDRTERSLACAFSVPGAVCSSRGNEWLEEVATAGFERHHEEERAHERSERLRLLYVAATRACDRLLIPVFEKPCAGSLLEPLAGRLPPEEGDEVGRLRASPELQGRSGIASAPADIDSLVAARVRRLQERGAQLRAASRPLAVTSPSRLERLDPEEASAPAAERAGEARTRALALGTAVHAVMERVSLTIADEADAAARIRGLARSAAAEAGAGELADRVAGLAFACWRSRPVREAAAADAVYQELSFCVPIEPDGGGGDAAQPGAAGEGAVRDPARPLLEGFCDLVYRSESGWVVVDYKTDAEPAEAAVTDRYGPQGGAYALAVRQLTGEPVVRVCFVLAAGAAAGRPAPYVELPVTQQMLEQARLAAAGDAVTRSVEDD